VLLKLYAEENSPELLQFVMTENHCAQEECRDFLLEKQVSGLEMDYRQTDRHDRQTDRQTIDMHLTFPVQ
jgi:hypothetical protein